MFTESDRRKAILSCRYCPMCHHADLVTTLERRETYSARARGLTLFAVDQGRAAMGPEVAHLMYRYFVDGLCAHVCAGHIPHDDMIIDARQRLVAAGHAPFAVSQVKENIAQFGNPWGAPEPDLRELTGAKPGREVLVYFGTTARIKRMGVIRALDSIFDKVGIDFSVLDQEGDCGLLLHQLGEGAAGATAAQSLAERIVQSGARTLITGDAEAYQALKIGFGDVPPLPGLAVVHLYDFLDQHIDQLHIGSQPCRRVAYHDPCALARSAACLDAPRRLLRSVCGTDPLEIDPWSGEFANCSGECGGVPFTNAALSRRAAERRIAEARTAGAQVIVTGSPASAAALEGRGLGVHELSEFVAELLE